VGLPNTLAALNLGTATGSDLGCVAEVDCRAGSHMHNLQRPVSVEEPIGVLESLRG
jgi:glycerol dehydrogenase-like iron-containing ADH family enzyme